MNEHEVYVRLYGPDLFASVPHYRGQIVAREVAKKRFFDALAADARKRRP